MRGNLTSRCDCKLNILKNVINYAVMRQHIQHSSKNYYLAFYSYIYNVSTLEITIDWFRYKMDALAQLVMSTITFFCILL